jgi:hypothetical protein
MYNVDNQIRYSTLKIEYKKKYSLAAHYWRQARPMGEWDYAL